MPLSSQTRLLPLRQIELPILQDPPELKIRTDQDVEVWKTTRGYADYLLFLHQLSEAVVGYTLPLVDPEKQSQEIDQILALLDTLSNWVDEIPPLPTPQRFGNLAFRTWGARLEERSDELLSKLLGEKFASASPYLKPYLLTSFGSFLRMDYGTGHESSFAIFLLCLTLIRFLKPEPDEERHLVLNVFVRYLQLCWKLQDVYRLEPAGSHGVWGLDDYAFLGYIFGSGQLRDQTDITVASVLNPPLPQSNLYFMSIMRIHQVKHGPFYEHSSQLHSIAVGVPNWGKVHNGLFKMYEAEVLGKRVVVQHLPLGGLMEWDTHVDQRHAPSMLRDAPATADTRAPLAHPR
ncbi:Phosphotyrosyl phosphatase activator [Suillus decipiens]|nr:Phosphotyrosyl phosphatase activator [Suillus decipiens]